MRVQDILKDNQPGAYNKLKKHSKDNELTEKDLINLMKHSSYKRSSGGAIRQVR